MMEECMHHACGTLTQEPQHRSKRLEVHECLLQLYSI